MHLKNLFTKSNVTFVITSVGLIASTIGIVSYFFERNTTSIKFQLLSNTNVFDIHEEIKPLDIIYNGQSIKNAKQNLKVFTLKISNNGDKDILNDFYDDRDPLGFQISKGLIIEKPTLIGASNSYIKKNLKLVLKNGAIITFSPIILETGEYFTAKILVLHNQSEEPTIKPVGKIAGIKEIDFIDENDLNNKNPVLELLLNSFSGNIFIQLTRSVIYFIIVVILIVLLIYVSDKINAFREKEVKLQLISEYKSAPKYISSEADEKIFEIFLTENYFYLKEIENLLSNQEILNNVYNKKANPKSIALSAAGTYFHDSRIDRIEELIHHGFVSLSKKKLITKNNIYRRLIEFNRFLKVNKNKFQDSKYIVTSEVISAPPETQ